LRSKPFFTSVKSGNKM